MSKKTVHIISHSHLDREWYLPFEAHRMRVVELLDTVLDLFDTDPQFKYFHVDGHTLPLDDYLEVRPNQKQRLQQAIDDGKLRIGPYYILQDAFLISEEANVRNALIGSQELEKWGVEGEKVGYFPDTFGLSGQIPQIVKETGMEFATFGRGVKPTGFNNVVINEGDFQSTFSEMYWQSPNQDEILGILFANWYSNGNEIPTTYEAAQKFWTQKLADAELYAATDHILMMNGCDHQPVQTDVSQAIELANELFPDYHFIHSNFTQYYQAIKAEGLPALSTVKGELRSQETDGWYTLANTASNRIHLKQRSHELSQRLEQVIEPLAVICQKYGYAYPYDKIDFAWKLLLQNYPHDSICACSVDEVIHGMEARFDQCEAVLDYLQAEFLSQLSGYHFSVKPEAAAYAIQIWNTTTVKKSDIATVKVEMARCQFSETSPSNAFEKMEQWDFGQWQVIDAEGNEYEAEIIDLGVEYHYDLPKDRFRVPYMARYAQVKILMKDLAPMSVKQLFLVPTKEMKQPTPSQQANQDRTIENEYLAVTVEPNGSLTLRDKRQQRTYAGQCILEDTGDSGNEYIFKESVGERIFSKDHLTSVEKESMLFEERLMVTYQWSLPISADEKLFEEQRRVIDITNRTSGRSSEMKQQTIQVIYTLKPTDKSILVKIVGQNDVKDHRIRMVWHLSQSSTHHLADSHYEIVTRANQVSAEWRNPSNPQVSRHAVSIHNEDNNQRFGLTVASKGNYEYEVNADDSGTTLAITILRCTGEMGDWGYFPTPEAQCLHDYQSDLSITLWDSEEAETDSLIAGRYQFVPLLTNAPLSRVQDEMTFEKEFAFLDSIFTQPLPKHLVITAVKMSRDQQHLAIRLVNLGEELADIRQLTLDNIELQPVNLLEQPYEATEEAKRYRIKNHQIQTYLINWELIS